MSADSIKVKLIEAYKTIDADGSSSLVHQNKVTDAVAAILIDPIYKFIYHMYTRGRGLPVNKLGKFDIVDKINIILPSMNNAKKSSRASSSASASSASTGTRSRVSSANSTVTNLYSVDIKTASTDDFDKLEKITNGDAVKPIAHLIPYAQIWKKIQTAYTSKSFQLFMQRIKQNLHMLPMYVESSSADSKEVTAVLTKEFQIYFKECDKALAIEDSLNKYKKLTNMKNWAKCYNEAAPRKFKNPEVSLGRRYGVDGHKHKFDIFVYNDGSTRTLKEIIKDSAESKYMPAPSDKQCTICKVLLSRVDTIDQKKIRENLSAVHDIKNFYIYFEHRCPKAPAHEYNATASNSDGASNSNSDSASTGARSNSASNGDSNGASAQCIHCSITPMIIANKDSDYYQRYRRDYESVTLVNIQPDIGTIQSADKYNRASSIDGNDTYSAEYADWSFNFNIVLDLANKLKINHKLLYAMGAIEKREYSEIASGAFIPAEVEFRDHTRIFIIDGHIKNLVTEYNYIRSFHKLLKPPQDIINVIEKSKINKYKIKELVENLPDVVDEYTQRYVWFYKNKSAQDLVMFCIQSFCETCLRIYDFNHRDTETLRHVFVNYFVNKTIHGESLLSKPGQFNWNLIYADSRKEATESTAEEAYGEEPVDDSNDDASPMESGFDMENDTENNTEGVDDDLTPVDEDSSNSVRAGEDYGLD